MPQPATWFPLRAPSPAARFRLFCFPYAGGSSAIFRRWAQSLPAEVGVCAAELPGRGMRLGEPAIDAPHALADAATQGLLPFLDRPFALFGHSLGAILGFEVALRLGREHGLAPRRLFVSGRGAPHIAVPRTSAHTLPDVDFVSHLRTLNGTPEVLLNNAELMELMLPAIRADFKASETYVYTPGSRLSCPVSAIGGLADGQVPTETVGLWSELTTGPFESRFFAGDHFFLHNQEASVVDLVRTRLAIDLYTMRP